MIDIKQGLVMAAMFTVLTWTGCTDGKNKNPPEDEVVSEIRPRNTHYTYNSLGQVTSVDGPRTDVTDLTTYEYDLATANLLSVTNAAGHKTTYSNYTSGGLAQNITTPNGAVINVQYTWDGKVTQQEVVTNLGTQLTAYSYDRSGNLTTVQQPNGSILTYVYDGAQRLIAMENSVGERIEYTLDSAGNITEQQVKDSAANIVRQHSQVFDDLSRLRQHVGGTDSQTTKLDYDADSRNTGVTDPKNNPSTQNTYNALNRLTQVVDSANGITTMTYNAHGLIETVTDPRGLVTTYGYNGYGELESITSPDTGVTSFMHDNAGNVTSRTNASGTVVNYSYDALNRLTEQSYPADATKNVLFSYDDTGVGINGHENYGKGQLTQITYNDGLIQYQYDQLGRLVAEQRSFGGQAYITQYSFDTAGQLDQVTYPSGRLVNYAYDSQGRLNGLSTQAHSNAAVQGIVSNLHYNPFGPVTGFNYGNGIAQSYFYDLDYRLTQITSNVQDWVYQYDLNSNIESISHNADTLKNQAYGYDELNRLISASGPYGDYTYQYDRVGNRTQRQKITPIAITVEDLIYATNANQLDSLTTTIDTVQTDSRLFTYSPSGQLITDINNERTIDYSYDENDRLAQVDVYKGNNQQAIYQYNPLGQRVVKNSGGKIQHIHYDSAGKHIAETDSNGKVIREYIYLGQQAIAMVVPEQSNEVYFVHNDHLGTPKILTDTNGNVVWEIHTTPFGEVHEEIANGLSNIKAFPGQYTDNETGLNYNYYRDYDPSLGRYVQSDPLGLYDGPNTYAYVHGNPLKFIDPLGLAVKWTCTRFSAGGNLLVVGGSKIIYTCRTKCENDSRIVARISISAKGVSLTDGRFGLDVFGSHNNEFLDEQNDDPNTNVFVGHYTEVGSGGAGGIGYGVGAASFNDGQVVGSLTGVQAGLGMATGELSGSSNVVWSRTEMCNSDCEY